MKWYHIQLMHENCTSFVQLPWDAHKDEEFIIESENGTYVGRAHVLSVVRFVQCESEE